MHHVRRAHDTAAVELTDALQPEAHAEHGHAVLAEVADRVVGEAGVLGRPGPGEISTASGSRASISSRVIASWRCTIGSAPSSPRYCTRL